MYLLEETSKVPFEGQKIQVHEKMKVPRKLVQYKNLDNKDMGIYILIFMCTGGGSTDKNKRRKIREKCYFLFDVDIVVSTTVPSSETIITLPEYLGSWY